MNEIKKLAVLKGKLDTATGRWMRDLFDARAEQAWKNANTRLHDYAKEQLNIALGHRGMHLVNAELATAAWNALPAAVRAEYLPVMSDRERQLVGLASADILS